MLLLFLRFIFCQKKERPFGLLRHPFMRLCACLPASVVPGRQQAAGHLQEGGPAGCRGGGVRPRRGGALCCRRSSSKGPVRPSAVSRKVRERASRIEVGRRTFRKDSPISKEINRAWFLAPRSHSDLRGGGWGVLTPSEASLAINPQVINYSCGGRGAFPGR